ncbi:3232_t:CDS:2 [Acaulospora morrowiae]|uniref:3232_t:CDS:1 n=1 Tax=Acaulospora morrowiae TaxID=94023 RepID=A0A9N9H059_9GLOM|nr:3232_t:CDS:2 [Acaulospora morrowiae]
MEGCGKGLGLDLITVDQERRDEAEGIAKHRNAYLKKGPLSGERLGAEKKEN